ncbi:MAG: hypothetical protein Q9163_000302 [Psora crenata]
MEHAPTARIWQKADKLLAPTMTEVLEKEEEEEEEEEDEEDEKGQERHGVTESLLVLENRSQGSLGIATNCMVCDIFERLRLSKSVTALAWIAAPLCGTVVQPLVGGFSDKCRSRWGRRRPFVLAGTLGTVLSMLLLAWTKQLVQKMTGFISGKLDADIEQSLVILFAIFCIYTLNISIQPVQAGIRALIVENCPLHQQSQASACASAMTGLGNIVGYIFGFAALPNIPTNSVTRFQILSLFATLSMSTTVAICCLAVREKQLLQAAPSDSKAWDLFPVLKELDLTYRRMPRRIRNVCQIQFLAWMGWFPFLFYSTTEGLTTSVRSSTATDDTATESHARSAIYAEAIRYGTFASFLFAMVAFACNLLLPYILPTSTQRGPCSTNTSNQIPPSIIRAWTYSHAFFAILVFATIFVTSQAGATAIVALAGVSWALTLFAPFAIISTELAGQHALQQDLTATADGSPYTVDANHAGAVMGLHNVAISAPQMIAAMVCSGIYATARACGSQEGTVWVLRTGGIAALAAAWLCHKFER